MSLRIVFFGSPELAVPSLVALAQRFDVCSVVTQPDRPAGRGQKLKAPAVKNAAQGLGIEVTQPEGVRSPDVQARLRELGADAFAVVAYGRILPAPVLDIPRLGAWNVHASLLPTLRGAAPINWAIMRGETRTGVSIMRMDAGLDTGPVAAMAEVPIAEDDTAGSLGGRLAPLGANLLVETLVAVEAGSIRLVAQDETRATHAPRLRKEDGRLDFHLDARAVSAWARGVDPWPGPTAALAGETIRLFHPRVLDASGTPGEILRLAGQGLDGSLIVACGRGAVAFAEIQFPGGKRLPAQAALSGRPLPPDARLE